MTTTFERSKIFIGKTKGDEHMQKLTPKAIRINMGLSRTEMVYELNKHGVTITERMLTDRENGVVDWSALEIIGIMDIAKIDDYHVIDLA